MKIDNRHAPADTNAIRLYLEAQWSLKAVLTAYAANPGDSAMEELALDAMKYFRELKMPSGIIPFLREQGDDRRYAYSRR